MLQEVLCPWCWCSTCPRMGTRLCNQLQIDFLFRCSMMQKPESRLEIQHAAAWSALVAFTMLTLYKGHTRSSSAQTTLMWVWLTDQPLVRLKQPAAKYGWNVAVPGVSGRTMLTNDSCGKRGIRGKGGEQTEPRSDWRESGVSKGASGSPEVQKLDPHYKKINASHCSSTETQLLHSFNLKDQVQYVCIYLVYCWHDGAAVRRFGIQIVFFPKTCMLDSFYSYMCKDE